MIILKTGCSLTPSSPRVCQSWRTPTRLIRIFLLFLIQLLGLTATHLVWASRSRGSYLSAYRFDLCLHLECLCLKFDNYRWLMFVFLLIHLTGSLLLFSLKTLLCNYLNLYLWCVYCLSFYPERSLKPNRKCLTSLCRMISGQWSRSPKVSRLAVGGYLIDLISYLT